MPFSNLTQLSFVVHEEYLHREDELTWNLKMDLWKTAFLYNPEVFRFHVRLFQIVCSEERSSMSFSSRSSKDGRKKQGSPIPSCFALK